MANSLNKITTKSILDATVATADIAADAVTGAKIADDAIDSEHYTDGSIDHAHLAADCVDGDNIQDDVINSEHIAAGAVDLEHMSSESVDEDNLKISNAGSNGQYLQKQSGNTGGLTWVTAQDTLSFRNLVINGAMTVAQRATSVTGVTTSGYRTCDRFKLGNASLGTWTITQESDGPDGFNKSLKILCTTADDGSGNYACLFYHIEGQDLQQLAFGTSNAKAMVFSFWVKSNKTGNASVELQQQDNSDKQVTYSYNISSANTWEKKTISVPADTSGVINDDTGCGIRLGWWLNSGSAGSFEGGTHRSTWTAEVNADRNVTDIGIGGAVNDYFQITGIQLEVDSTGSGVATDFEHRSYGDELTRCRRYFQRDGGGAYSGVGIGLCASSTHAIITHLLVPAMRAAPSITSEGNIRGYDGSANANVGTWETNRSSTTQLWIEPTKSGAGWTQGRPLLVGNNNDTSGYFNLSAEL